MASQRHRRARAARRSVLAFIVPALMLAASSWTPAAATEPGPDVVPTAATSASSTLSVGDTFDYTIGVTNQGDQTAHGVVVTDDLPTGFRLVGPPVLTFGAGQCTATSSQRPGAPPSYSYYCTLATLAAGSSASVTFPVEVTIDVHCGTVENHVRARANDEPAANRSDDTVSVSVDVACPPSIALTKTGPAYARVGDRVAFTLRVSNDGRVAFDHVRVTDPGCDATPALVADGDGDGVLAPHEAWVYRCTSTIARGTPHLFTTSARVVGRSSTGNARALARATVRVVHPRVGIAVVASPTSGSPGDVITYRYVVRNRGDAVLSNLVVTDDRLGPIGTIARLSPGHSTTLRATRVLSSSGVWVVNTATVTAAEPSGRSVVASADAAITLVAATGDHNAGDGTAFTGNSTAQPTFFALCLLLVGATLLTAARRRT